MLWCGSSFHTQAAVTQKAQSPSVYDGTMSDYNASDGDLEPQGRRIRGIRQ